MTDERTSTCAVRGRAIFPATARATGGICRPCVNQRAAEASRERWIEERRRGLTPLTPRQFDQLAGNADLETLCHAVFDKAHWRWSDEALRGTISAAERTVLAVEMFFGEVCNGGVEQYLCNDSADFANELPEALLRVGLPAYAAIAHQMLELFPGPLSSDSDERLDAVEALDESAEDDLLGEIDGAFFDLYHTPEHGGFPRRLHEYIRANREAFLRLR